MSKPVVLVLGNDSFATRVAELARDAGNTVILASPAAKEMDK
jgi:flagellar biosynthesis protein FlhB